MSSPSPRQSTAALATLALMVAACTQVPATANPTVSATPTAIPAASEVAGVIDASWSDTATEHRGRNGERIVYECPPDGSAGVVWGSDVYTDDSSVCTAGVHAGVITLEDGGLVTIAIEPGRDSYEASERNGISTHSYGEWHGSFVVQDGEDRGGAAGVGIRDCAYRPGAPVATMPREIREQTPTPAPSFEDPERATVPAAVTAEQIEVLDSLEMAVEEHYHDPNLNGQDWDGIVQGYRQLFRSGVAEEQTSALLNQMLFRLDEHSQIESPEEITEAEAAYEAALDYVGIGVLVQPLPESGGVILSVFADSPAEAAGLLPHDKILEVDGEPLVFHDVLPNPILGEPDTDVVLTVERPGEGTREVTLTRAPISGGVPITACIVPETTIGYIGIPCFCDVTLGEQVEEALTAMAAAGGITGLVLDNRINGGGHSQPLTDLLSFFLDGEVGAFVGPDGERPMEIDGEDIGGSQDLPLVVLVGQETGSFGEVASGVLQVVDGATVVGSTSPGNVEILTGYDLAHGWRAWIAHETFEPAVDAYGPWEETGIIPDVAVPTRWDLFSEANDPALAEAVEILLSRE